MAEVLVSQNTAGAAISRHPTGGFGSRRSCGSAFTACPMTSRRRATTSYLSTSSSNSCKPSPADSPGPDGEDVFLAVQDAQLLWGVDLLPADGRLEGGTEILQGLDGREPGGAPGSLETGVVAQADLDSWPGCGGSVPAVPRRKEGPSPASKALDSGGPVLLRGHGEDFQQRSNEAAGRLGDRQRRPSGSWFSRRAAPGRPSGRLGRPHQPQGEPERGQGEGPGAEPMIDPVQTNRAWRPHRGTGHGRHGGVFRAKCPGAASNHRGRPPGSLIPGP